MPEWGRWRPGSAGCSDGPGGCRLRCRDGSHQRRRASRADIFSRRGLEELIYLVGPLLCIDPLNGFAIGVSDATPRAIAGAQLTEIPNTSVRPQTRVEMGRMNGRRKARRRRYRQDAPIAIVGVGRSELFDHYCPAALSAEATRPAWQTEQSGRKLSVSPSKGYANHSCRTADDCRAGSP